MENLETPPRIIKILVIDVLGIVLLHNLKPKITWLAAYISKIRHKRRAKSPMKTNSKKRSFGDPAEVLQTQNPAQETIEFQDIQSAGPESEQLNAGILAMPVDAHAKPEQFASWKEVACVLNRIISFVYLITSVVVLFKYLIPLFHIYWSRSAESE